MKLNFLTNILMVVVLITSFSTISCSDDKDGNEINRPIINIEQDNATFITKVGKEITISPKYESVANATYAWKIDNKIISTEPIFSYKSDEPQEIFVTLEVTNNVGMTFKELKISVVPLLIPTLLLSAPPEGYKIVHDSELEFTPEVKETNENIKFTWYVNDKQVADTKNYVFSSSKVGQYILKVIASTEDGRDSLEIAVEVCNPEDLPFKWTFEQETFSLSTGRQIRIKIWDIENDFDATYTWEINGVKKQEGKETQYIFGEKEIGLYNVKVTMKNQYSKSTKNLKVNVSEKEGTYKRPATTSSLVASNKVYEFLAAPGQFTNEFYTANTMAQAVEYAQQRLKEGLYVSLGAWGGYIVVGFDHSIENKGGYDIQIIGNSFEGSSEPGIVWVMQDENGNGLPDDTWYELKGSEYGKPETIQDYSLTYYRPQSPHMPVQWIDNQGNSGTIDYNAAYHSQEYYYPLWVKEDSYTLYGTCLQSRTYDQSGNGSYWVNGKFDWGYADNFSGIDRLTNEDEENTNARVNANHFKISDAVTFDGKAANLKYIDFVKIQTGVNAKAGWLGENSTEVFGVNDYYLMKK